MYCNSASNIYTETPYSNCILNMLIPTAEFATYLNHTRNLRFDEKPDYSFLRQLFRNLFHRLGYTYDYVFDWNMLKFVSVLCLFFNWLLVLYLFIPPPPHSLFIQTCFSFSFSKSLTSQREKSFLFFCLLIFSLIWSKAYFSFEYTIPCQTLTSIGNWNCQMGM